MGLVGPHYFPTHSNLEAQKGARFERCGLAFGPVDYHFELILCEADQARHHAFGLSASPARCRLTNPKIVILDEATSAIDSLTEAKIQRALQVLFRGRTSFVIAHRLSTVRNADGVLVLDRGRIVERGTHQELIAADGVYAAMYRQFLNGSV